MPDRLQPGQLDEAVGINAVERFLGDEAMRRVDVTVDAPPSGKRVLVVGAGPAGLSAAYHLRLLGHDVTVRDAGERPGGMMRYGIPAYRLPRDVLDAEIDRIVDLGVRLELGAPSPTSPARWPRGSTRCSWRSAPARPPHRDLPAGDSARILDAIAVLHGPDRRRAPLLGRRVAVYGGGNTAMDAARGARRLGATDALVVYRRTRDRMPAHDGRGGRGDEEGVPHAVAVDDRARRRRHASPSSGCGWTTTGFPQPTGEVEELAADAVVLAIGQDVDRFLVAVLPVWRSSTATCGRSGPDDRRIRASSPAATSCGGADRHHGDRPRPAGGARHRRLPARQPRTTPAAARAAAFDRLNTWYYSDARPPCGPCSSRPAGCPRSTRWSAGWTPPPRCSRRAGACPAATASSATTATACARTTRSASSARASGYEIDYDYCKGCGICVAECPAGAIEMRPERT